MPREGKVPAETKLRIVESYLAGKIGYTSAYEGVGVSDATLWRWISRYKTEGAKGLEPSVTNRNYEKETKISAVMDYLAGKGSLRDICEKYRIRDKRQLWNWVKVYNRHKDFKIQSGGSRMTKGRDTTAEERIEIVKVCTASGNDYGGTALKYQQVYTWTKKYHEMGEAGLEDRRGRRAGTLPSRTPEEELRDKVAQLERKNYELEMGNVLLKKVKELERRRR